MKCDHCGVKRFVCLMYNCTDLNICAFCSSDKLSSPNSNVSISKLSINCRLFVNCSRASTYNTAGNRHKQNSWFCKEIREDNFRFWWRRVHEDASQGMYMSKSEIFFLTARILQNQRMLCCGECFHD